MCVCLCMCVGEPGTPPAEESRAENREDGIKKKKKEEKIRLMKSNEQNKREEKTMCGDF